MNIGRRVGILGILAACAIGTPAQAQPRYDIALAKAAYETAKASGIRPQTTGELNRCAGYWEAVSRVRKGNYVLSDDWAALGDDFSEAGILIKKAGFKLDLDKSGALDARHLDEAIAAIKLLQGFLNGDDEATKSVFDVLGSCQRG
ncbi:MAG: hypothetical protein QNJ15_13290 [Erythrobacter sp.]|nr:hypothetical protein [Erythrobacter sp.]